MSKSIVALSFLFLSIQCFSQKETNIWYFGGNAGMNFNSGAPVALLNGALNQEEGCATICNKSTGAILFYTDGISVWNANNTVMPNGTGLTGNNSSAQSAIIVPNPANANQYYIFTAGEYFSSGASGYRYSIVDMTLAGGLGDVTGVKNVLLYAPACEKLCAVKNASSTGYWIATHQWSTNFFVIYPLTASGVGAPVVSVVGTVYSTYNPIGCMKFSPDGTRLATVLSGLDEVEVYDFNDTTGGVTNAINLGPITNVDPYIYGISFSPNGKLIYTDEENNKGLFQFNLAAGNPAAINASKTVVGSTSGYALQTIQLAPDGKMYITRNGSGYVAVVNNPDAIGFACNYVDSGFYLAGRTCLYGLPASVESVFSVSVPPPSANLQASDSVLCQNDCINFTDLSSNANTWQWTFNGAIPPNSTDKNPQTICYLTTGKYDVKLVVSNSGGSDSITYSNYINVSGAPLTPSIRQSGATLYCSTDSSYISYQWYDSTTFIPGATDTFLVVTHSGNYNIQVTNANGCKIAVGINIVLDVQVFTDNTFSLYPNPVINRLSVNSSSYNNGYAKVYIRNTLGQILCQYVTTNPKCEIDVSSFSSGIYFIEISFEKERWLGRFVKE